MKKLLLAFIPAAALLASCASTETADSSTVKQTEIYPSYDIKYDAADGNLRATASFRFGGASGTTMRLVDPSKVTYNGKDMEKQNNFLSGTYYSYSIAGYESTHTFEYTDNDGKKYKNTIALEPCKFDERTMTVPDGKAFNATVTIGDPKDVTLYASDTAHIDEAMLSSDPNAKVYYDASAKTLRVAPEFFEHIRSSECSLILKSVKTKDQLDQTNHLGGSMEIEYRSQPLKITRSKTI